MAKNNKSAILVAKWVGGDSGYRAGRLLVSQYQAGEKLNCRGPGRLRDPAHVLTELTVPALDNSRGGK